MCSCYGECFCVFLLCGECILCALVVVSVFLCSLCGECICVFLVVVSVFGVFLLW